MYRFALLSCVLVLVQAGDDFMPKCGRFLHPGGLGCCNKKYVTKSGFEEIKECMQLPGKPPSCDRETCIAKIKGFGKADGTIDRAGLIALFNKEGENAKELAEAVKADCFEGDLSKYGPPDFCELMKLRTCMHLHIVVDCPDWNNDGDCSGVSEAAEECIQSL